MNEVKYFKAWLAFFLAATGVGLLAILVVLGFAKAIIQILIPEDPDAINRYIFLFQILQYTVALSVSFFCFRWAVSKYILPQVMTRNAEQLDVEVL